MRYDKTIYFVTVDGKQYDATTGDYTDGTPEKIPVKASIMDTNTETLRLVYGEIRQGSYTVQLQNHYTETFDYIEINGKKYSVDYRRRLRLKDTFIVSEVQ